jgi:hypothetical protein
VTTADPLDLDTFCASGPAQRVIELGGYSDDGVSALAQSQLASFTENRGCGRNARQQLPAVGYQFPVKGMMALGPGGRFQLPLGPLFC